jgi:hypothetical protein
MVLIISTFILMMGCQAVSSPPVPSTSQPIHVLAVQDDISSRSIEGLPPELIKSIRTELSQFNIQPTFSTDNNFDVRQTEHRLHSMQKPALLIETKAEYFSQLNGRFRWVVYCKLTVVGEDDTQISREFTTPVFHQFHHEREAEALVAAQDIISQELNRLMEDYLRAKLK